jgi:hypothetical protein
MEENRRNVTKMKIKVVIKSSHATGRQCFEGIKKMNAKKGKV